MNKTSIVVASGDSALVVDGHNIRRDGDMWCMTDVWRAAGAPKTKRPAEWLRKDGVPFIEFMQDSLDMALGHIKKDREKSSIVRSVRGKTATGEYGETWGHWQISLAYAKWISHPFHARVNEVYRAFTAGLLAPADSAELIRLQLRLRALNKADYESIWDLELKLELARLRKSRWSGTGVEPRGLQFAYGRTWRIILGDRVYDELKVRNPHPRDGSLHGQWVQEQRLQLARREDMVIALAFARRSSRWAEYETEMRSHFRRAPIQLRLVGAGERR
jgi:hypothetical protein